VRILLLNQFYVPDVAATGQLLHDLARTLHQRGHEVHVIASQGAYSGGGERLPAEETIDGIHVHRTAATGLGRSNILFAALDYLTFYVLATLRCFTLRKMDVCLVLTTPPFIGLVGVVLHALRGTRLALWTMDLYPEVAIECDVLPAGSMRHRFFAALSRLTYRKAAAIFALGEHMARRLTDAGADPETVYVVHNWVPREVVYPVDRAESHMRRSLQPTPDQVVLMYSGNIGRGHGLDAAVDAIARLTPDQRRHVRVVFVGSGRMRQPLLEKVEQLGLQDTVEFRDYQPLEMLSDSLGAADVHLVGQRPDMVGLIVPSKLYGILAAGRAVLFVGPEQCEVADILRSSGVGWIAQPHDPQSIAEALQGILENRSALRQKGRDARSFYEARFGCCRSTARIADELEAIAQ
jgi:glycosyltransferase involved in cell wall biosynthesis